MRQWALLLVLGATSCESCEPDPPVTRPEEEAPNDAIELPTPDLRLVFLTDLKGYLEPCGCTSHPLGGIDRMRHRLRALEQEAPTAFLATGDLFFGNESHAGPASTEADLWQAETLVRILNEAGLDAATPGALDAARADDLAHLESLAEFPMVAAGWTIGERELMASAKVELGERTIEFLGISDGQPTENDVTPTEELVVVLARASRREARALSELDADFLVLGGIDREEAAAPSEHHDTWMLQGGRQGQGLLVLDLYRPDAEGPWQNLSQWTLDATRAELDAQIEDLEQQLARWREEGEHAEADLQRQARRLEGLKQERRAAVAPTFPETGRVFAARWEPLEHDLEGDPATRRILEALDVRINDHNRAAFADRTPPPVDEGAAHYVGSQACASCHAAAHAWWESHPHGRAYATLEERNKQFHLSCVGCHVTGYERPGGSTVTHLLDGALQNVGCEVCHGAGSAHIASSSAEDITRQTEERLCITCHNEEHSDLFQYEAYRATLLVPGHGRPVE